MLPSPAPPNASGLLVVRLVLRPPRFACLRQEWSRASRQASTASTVEGCNANTLDFLNLVLMILNRPPASRSTSPRSSWMTSPERIPVTGNNPMTVWIVTARRDGRKSRLWGIHLPGATT